MGRIDLKDVSFYVSLDTGGAMRVLHEMQSAVFGPSHVTAIAESVREDTPLCLLLLVPLTSRSLNGSVIESQTPPIQIIDETNARPQDARQSTVAIFHPAHFSPTISREHVGKRRTNGLKCSTLG